MIVAPTDCLAFYCILYARSMVDHGDDDKTVANAKRTAKRRAKRTAKD